MLCASARAIQQYRIVLQSHPVNTSLFHINLTSTDHLFENMKQNFCSFPKNVHGKVLNKQIDVDEGKKPRNYLKGPPQSDLPRGDPLPT